VGTFLRHSVESIIYGRLVKLRSNFKPFVDQVHDISDYVGDHL